MDANERQADGGEEAIDEHITHFALLSFMAVVVQFDPEHGHPVIISADQKIDVLLAHLVEPSQVVVLKDISEPRLAQNSATLL